MIQNDTSKELAQTYAELRKKLTLLNVYWDNFCVLYTDKNAVDVLNRSASDYFSMNQTIWSDFIILEISKLTDPELMNKYKNLSFERIVKLVDESKYPDLKKSLEADIKDLDDICKPIRNIRNKLISHNDLEGFIQPQTKAIDNVFIRDIEQALQKMGEILDKIRKYFKVDESIPCIHSLRFDARKLLELLGNSERDVSIEKNPEAQYISYFTK